MRTLGFACCLPGILVVFVLHGCTPETDEEGGARARVEFYTVAGTGGKIGYDETDPRKPIIALDLERSSMLDAGLRPVGKLKSLRTLNLLGADRLTDQGIKFLEGLPNLEHLDLGQIGISSKSLEHIKGLSTLQSLGLSGNPLIDDAALEHLATLKNLRKVNLAHTAITDAGLNHLLELKALNELDLSVNHQISDQGLKRLRGLKKLQTLKVTETAVTEEGVKGLKAVLPKLVVVGPESS
jgi:hypothetical protein